MSRAVIDLQVALDEPDPALPSESELQHWVNATLARHTLEADTELTLRLVSSDESQTLNRTYRNKDKPTNVLSFPFEAPLAVEIPLLGDLVICHDVVVREAQEQHKALTHHYAHMVVHGTLHLLGYDHIEDADAEQMETLEREILADFGINDPYAPTGASSHDQHDNEDSRPDA